MNVYIGFLIAYILMIVIISAISRRKVSEVSGYLLGVNPFNQPGVESYKKNMFALLGKPGYESQKASLEAKLQ